MCDVYDECPRNLFCFKNKFEDCCTRTELFTKKRGLESKFLKLAPSSASKSFGINFNVHEVKTSKVIFNGSDCESDFGGSFRRKSPLHPLAPRKFVSSLSGSGGHIDGLGNLRMLGVPSGTRVDCLGNVTTMGGMQTGFQIDSCGTLRPKPKLF